ncbi:hypothetical protein BsWGS_21356 [Bradybaena similaris]
MKRPALADTGLLVSLLVLRLILCSEYGSGSEISDDNENADLYADEITFIVLSQVNEFHAHQAIQFREHFKNQFPKIGKVSRPQLLFSHTNFSHVDGTWTIIPLIEHIVNEYFSGPPKWILICEEDTRINVSLLVATLQSYNASENLFLGRELRDQQTTIIHHFAFVDNPSQFAYPDFRAGFVMSAALVRHLHQKLQTSRVKADFSIDPKFELALFIWDEGKGTTLTHMPQFCSADESSDPNCATAQPGKFPDCGVPIDNSDLYVAVKTCQKFHDTRIPIVKTTWGKEAALIEYFSEVADQSIPTIDLGVPNTERGHCGKTMAIIKRIINTPKLSAVKWILIADDDTIINVGRLRTLLACYNHEQLVVLGERYGYAILSGGGYDYITGGGGMVFSVPAVKLLAEKCKCYKDDAPDDMTLGMFFKSFGVPLTHSRFFHQARPDDYSRDFLANQLPVSFHKHWNNDPYKVYAQLTTPPIPERVDTKQSSKRASQKRRDEL